MTARKQQAAGRAAPEAIHNAASLQAPCSLPLVGGVQKRELPFHLRAPLAG